MIEVGLFGELDKDINGIAGRGYMHINPKVQIHPGNGRWNGLAEE